MKCREKYLFFFGIVQIYVSLPEARYKHWRSMYFFTDSIYVFAIVLTAGTARVLTFR